ncbi:MAG: hypothetical protein IJ092_00545 [Atopobiaceae bacterium]|nr:hypothetical protein [Atopobiaceae bacterium]MBQ9317418.1 hypothetical protein [Atopobiaceae bacterium]
MPVEYVVDCELMPLTLDGRRLVLPYGTAEHVHERLIRCEGCDYLQEGSSYCKLWHKSGLGGRHFCSYASPKATQ